MFRKKAPAVGLPPAWLVVGLGNPGAEYRGTRHNVGFEVVEELARGAGAKIDRAKHRAQTGLVLVEGLPVLLAKPLTFMNLSGQSVGPLLSHAGLKPDRLVVIADDLDLPLGRVRFRMKGSAGGHNGHKSLIASLGTQDYARIKIGIGRPGEGTIDHVLGSFTPIERVDIDRAVRLAANVVRRYVSEGEMAALRELELANEA